MVFLCTSVQTQSMLWRHISVLCRRAVHRTPARICDLTDGHTDMTELKGAFRYFANAPKRLGSNSLQYSACSECSPCILSTGSSYVFRFVTLNFHKQPCRLQSVKPQEFLQDSDVRFSRTKDPKQALIQFRRNQPNILQAVKFQLYK